MAQRVTFNYTITVTQSHNCALVLLCTNAGSGNNTWRRIFALNSITDAETQSQLCLLGRNVGVFLSIVFVRLLVVVPYFCLSTWLPLVQATLSKRLEELTSKESDIEFSLALYTCINQCRWKPIFTFRASFKSETFLFVRGLDVNKKATHIGEYIDQGHLPISNSKAVCPLEMFECLMFSIWNRFLNYTGRRCK